MTDKANITYNQIADRNTQTAFAQTANEIAAVKRALLALEARFSETGYGAAGISSVSADVSATDIRETADGLVVLTLAFTVTLGGSPGYESFLVLGKGFPKLAAAGAVSYLSAPPSAGSVTCTVLPDGNVMIGTNGTGGELDCVATAVWKRR